MQRRTRELQRRARELQRRTGELERRAETDSGAAETDSGDAETGSGAAETGWGLELHWAPPAGTGASWTRRQRSSTPGDVTGGGGIGVLDWLLVAPNPRPRPQWGGGGGGSATFRLLVFSKAIWYILKIPTGFDPTGNDPII